MNKYLDMVAKSRLLAPNLKKMTLHVYSNTQVPNRIAREVVRDHLLGLRWMNPAAVITLRETRGPGISNIQYQLADGRAGAFDIQPRFTADLVVGKVLMAARDPALDAPAPAAAPAAGAPSATAAASSPPK